MTGTLYGVGLGPGAPDLLTLRAARLIEGARVIAYPQLAGAASFARRIASDLIAPDAREIAIDVPMTPARAPAQAAYDTGAAQLSEVLASGADVVLLCEGDPLFYGSFMYVQARLKDRFSVQVVPGVTAMTACAARARLPLGARNEVITVLPAPLPDAELRPRIAGADTVAFLKVGRHLARLRSLIADMGLAERAIYVGQAELATELCVPLAEAPDAAPYFSMILLSKGCDPWL